MPRYMDRLQGATVTLIDLHLARMVKETQPPRGTKRPRESTADPSPATPLERYDVEFGAFDDSVMSMAMGMVSGAARD